MLLPPPPIPPPPLHLLLLPRLLLMLRLLLPLLMLSLLLLVVGSLRRLREVGLHVYGRLHVHGQFDPYLLPLTLPQPMRLLPLRRRR